MEKSEPALVPQWLRSAGSVASSAPHFASSSNHTGNFDVLICFRVFYAFIFINSEYYAFFLIVELESYM